MTLGNLGASEARLGQLERAELHLRRGLAIKEQSLGPDHPELAPTLGTLGVIRRRRGDQRAAAAARADGRPHVSVLTRNLYLGTGLTNLVTATAFIPDFVGAVSQDWNNVVANDFPRRAKALATEIQLTQPDVVGLQEVSLWQDQFISDIVQGETVPNASDPVYDFLKILQNELAARGIRYTAVSTPKNADAEAPRPNPASTTNGFTDVRITDYDVILARSNIASRFSNRHDGRYGEQLMVASIAGPVTFTRGWASIDYALAGKTVRIFDTHLETEEAPPVQVGQGAEALAIINSSPYPVIALGDYNSAADGSTTPTYANLIAGGLTDAWKTVRPSNPGLTCCQDERLDTLAQPSERIDLVLTKGPWHADLAVRTGVLPFRLSPPPLWASDHFGVFADLEPK